MEDRITHLENQVKTLADITRIQGEINKTLRQQIDLLHEVLQQKLVAISKTLDLVIDREGV